MKYYYSFTILLFIAYFWGCSSATKTEKVQNKRDKIINIREKVKEIPMEEIILSNWTTPYIMNDFLLISDHKSRDKLIHIFNKNNFQHITSIANRGQGPGEIANLGRIGINEPECIFYLSDHGKQRIFSYKMDSVLVNPQYLPEVKMIMKELEFPDRYFYINDTLCVGLIIVPGGRFNHKQSLSKWNMNTGEIKTMKYTHPEIENKRVYFAVSVEKNLYVECYEHHDLMTICSLDGDLKYNIYGKKWDNKTSNKYVYYNDVVFCKDKIVALYSPGDDNYPKDKNGYSLTHYPTKFLVFDLKGNYIKTLETGYNIIRICYDKDNNRLIMTLDDEIQFAYLDLNELI